MGRRASGALFKEARVSLKEIDVIEQIERERPKVEERRYEAPVLSLCQLVHCNLFFHVEPT